MWAAMPQLKSAHKPPHSRRSRLWALLDMASRAKKMLASQPLRERTSSLIRLCTSVSSKPFKATYQMSTLKTLKLIRTMRSQTGNSLLSTVRIATLRWWRKTTNQLETISHRTTSFRLRQRRETQWLWPSSICTGKKTGIRLRRCTWLEISPTDTSHISLAKAKEHRTCQYWQPPPSSWLQRLNSQFRLPLTEWSTCCLNLKKHV